MPFMTFGNFPLYCFILTLFALCATITINSKIVKKTAWWENNYRSENYSITRMRYSAIQTIKSSIARADGFRWIQHYKHEQLFI